MGIGISTSTGGRALQHLSTLRVLVYQLHPKAGHCSIQVLYGYWYINFIRKQVIAAFEFVKGIGPTSSSMVIGFHTNRYKPRTLLRQGSYSYIVHNGTDVMEQCLFIQCQTNLESSKVQIFISKLLETTEIFHSWLI